jgi:NADH:ubiquinone reductase (non-electrogenic)
MHYYYSEAYHIDLSEKKVFCRSLEKSSEKREFQVEFDKLVVGVGCVPNTFDIPGVLENTFFLKELSDSRKVRTEIIRCFETARVPCLTDQERSELLHFVIVGGCGLVLSLS